MTQKLKRMQVILVIASILILFADISLFASSLISHAVIKFLIGLIVPTILLLLSFEVESQFKFEKCSKIIYIISMLTYMASFIGTLNSVIKLDGIELGKYYINNNVLIFLFGLLLSIISYFVQKDKLYLKTSYFFAIGTIYYLISSVFSESIGLLVLSCIVLLSSIFAKKDFIKFINIITYICILPIIAILIDDYSTTLEIINCISIAIFISTSIINIRKEENIVYDIISFIFMTICLIYLMIALDNFAFEIELVVSITVVSLIDMLLSVFDIGKNKKEALGYKIVLDLMSIFILIEASISNTAIMPVVIIVLLTSIIETYALKSDKYEQYMLPLKLITSLVALFVFIDKYITVDYIVVMLAINVASIIGFLLCNNKVFKGMFTFVIIVSIFAFMFDVNAIFDFVVMMTMLVFDYYVLFVLKNNINTAGKIFYLIMILFAYFNLNLFDNNLVYLLLAVILAIVYFIEKDKTIKNMSWVIALIALITFINEVITIPNIADLVTHIVLFYGLLYILNISKKVSENVTANVALLIIMYFISLVMNSVEVNLAMLFEILSMIFITYKDGGKVYKASIVMVVISLLTIIYSLDALPTFVYLFIIGFAIIVVIYLAIKKYLSEDHTKEIKEENKKEEIKINPEFKYCSECGNKITKDSNFCNKCGNKVK